MAFNGQKLREIRQERGLTLEALANMLGLDRQAIHNWEAGRHGPTEKNRTRLAKILGISEKIFFD